MRTLFLRLGVDRRGNRVAQEVLICGTQSRLRGGKLTIMLSKAFEESANRLDMRYRIGIEHNDIVEVCRHLFQVLDHLIDHLDELPRRSAAALRHNKPLVEARGCAERCKRHRILMRLYLVERRNQVEQGKHPS